MCIFRSLVSPVVSNEAAPASLENNNGGSFKIPVKLLRIDNVFVIKTEINEEEKFIIHVGTAEKGCECHKCGKHTDEFKRYGAPVLLRHLDTYGYETYLTRCSTFSPLSSHQTEAALCLKNGSQTRPLYEKAISLQICRSDAKGRAP